MKYILVPIFCGLWAIIHYIGCCILMGLYFIYSFKLDKDIIKYEMLGFEEYENALVWYKKQLKDLKE